MPSSTFTHTTRVPAQPSTIWEALQQADTWVGLALMDTVSRPVTVEGRLVSFDWSAVAAGTRHTGTAVAGESLPGEKMVLTLDSAEIAGTISVDLSPAVGGADMTVTLTARSRGFLSGMFWGVVSDALQRGLSRQVEAFAEGF